jgi:hypothetical protein
LSFKVPQLVSGHLGDSKIGEGRTEIEILTGTSEIPYKESKGIKKYWDTRRGRKKLIEYYSIIANLLIEFL